MHMVCVVVVVVIVVQDGVLLDLQLGWPHLVRPAIESQIVPSCLVPSLDIIQSMVVLSVADSFPVS